MYLKATAVDEFLLTHVTHQPSTFIVWFKQMSFQRVPWCKTFWTVSTWVRLCTSVNTNMTLEVFYCLKQLPAVRTFIRSSVAVYMTFMCLYGAGSGETFATQWTFVSFISCVDSHVCVSKHEELLNAFSQTWHLYVFSPLWILLCLTSSPDVLNHLQQTVHSDGFSPEWFRLCTANVWLFWQHLQKSEHLYLLLWAFIYLCM